MTLTEQSPIYQGQFGTFTINEKDRLEVIIYRVGLTIASLTFCIGSGLILKQGLTDTVMMALTPLFYLFMIGLAVSLQTIHIYLKPLHNALKILLLIGFGSTIYFSFQNHNYLIQDIINNHFILLGIGCSFAALTGIFIKEAFCFNRLEAKFLSGIIPALLLGYMFNLLPLNIEQFLLTTWCLLFIVFALRKSIQDIPSDIGDKSVFVYLKQQKETPKI